MQSTSTMKDSNGNQHEDTKVNIKLEYDESNNENEDRWTLDAQMADDLDEPLDKEKIHKEMEEKLRAVLAKEGKVYPPPKSEASHPIFANDGSFLETFKRMQEQMQQIQQQSDSDAKMRAPVCKRRGGKILKTGIVAKSKPSDSHEISDPKDVWSVYLQEVKKYKNTSCDVDSKTRPLVK